MLHLHTVLASLTHTHTYHSPQLLDLLAAAGIGLSELPQLHGKVAHCLRVTQGLCLQLGQLCGRGYWYNRPTSVALNVAVMHTKMLTVANFEDQSVSTRPCLPAW